MNKFINQARRLYLLAKLQDNKFDEDNYVWIMGTRTIRKIKQEMSIIYGDTLTNLYGIKIHYDHDDHDALKLYKNIKED